jgi:cell division protein FtsB
MSARAQAARGYRMRPTPRRGARGSGASRIRWDKLGRVVLVIVLFVILVSYVNPAVNFLDAWRDSRSERAQLHELQRQNAELRVRANGLSGPDAAERAARELGMVAESERSYVICSAAGCDSKGTGNSR